MNEVNKWLSCKKTTPSEGLYIYRKWAIHNNLLTGHHLSRIMPSSGIFFNQRISRQSPTSTLGLIWPLSTMCKLAWRHQFPAIFPWSLFSKPGKKNTEHSKNSIQEVYGFGDHFTWYYQYSLHLQITLVKQKKVTLIFSELVKWKIIRKKTCN